MTRALRLLVWSPLLLLFAACGFQLRGAVVLPPVMERTVIEGVAPASAAGDAAARMIRRAGGEIVPGREEATAVLELRPPRFERRVSAVDAGGRASEYQLTLSLSYALLTPETERLIPARTLTVRRAYDVDATDALGVADEAERLQGEMLEEAIRRMLEQIRRAPPGAADGRR